jgi:hypothetical protein
MTGVIIFNVVTIALGGAVAAGLVPNPRLSGMLQWLHSIIGITPPVAEKARLFALIWIASTIVLVDGLLFMLVFLTTRVAQT